VGLAPLEVALARCTHVLLYLIFIGMPIAGLVNAVAAGHSVSLFGVVSIRPLLPENDRLSRLAIALHLVRQYLIYFFVTLHVAGALLHARPPRRSARADAAASPQPFLSAPENRSSSRPFLLSPLRRTAGNHQT
jgi:cytochrome b561